MIAQPEPVTRVNLILWGVIGSTIPMLLFYAARVYVRLSVVGKFGLDDWIMLGAVIFTTTEGVLSCVATHHGAGYRMKDFQAEWIESYGKYIFVPAVLFTTCITLPKISLCCTYLRIFPSRVTRIVCYMTIAYLTGWMVVFTTVTIFACQPLQASWNAKLAAKHPKCINFRAYYISYTVLDTISDFIVFLFPATIFWRVQLPVKQRLGLIAMFGVGCMVCITGILRVQYNIFTFKTGEWAYDGAIGWVLAAIEVNIGIICACLHAIKPLLSSLLSKTVGTLRSSMTADGRRGSTTKRTMSSTYRPQFQFQQLPSQGQSVIEPPPSRGQSISEASGKRESPLTSDNRTEVSIPLRSSMAAGEEVENKHKGSISSNKSKEQRQDSSTTV